MTEKTKRIIEKNEKDLKAAQKLIKECDNTIKRVDKLLAEIRRERLQKEKIYNNYKLNIILKRCYNIIIRT